MFNVELVIYGSFFLKWKKYFSTRNETHIDPYSAHKMFLQAYNPMPPTIYKWARKQ